MNPPQPATEADDLVRPPQQERSRKTLDRIVRAALALIDEKGIEGASVHDIARRARASVGSFYARFRGKEDLLRYLELQLWADAERRWSALRSGHDWDSLSFEELVTTLVHVLIEVHKTGARQRRILESRRGPAAGSEAARAFDRVLGADIRGLILRHEREIDSAEPERAIDLCVAAIRGVLRMRDTEALQAESLEALDDEGWARVLAGLCLTYLTGGVRAEPQGEQVDFFEIWG